MPKTKFYTPQIDDAKQNGLKRELIVLDFTQHDTIAELKRLITLFEENKADGMIFAVALKHERNRNHIFGSTGRASANPLEAIAMGALLQHHLLNDCAD